MRLMMKLTVATTGNQNRCPLLHIQQEFNRGWLGKDGCARLAAQPCNFDVLRVGFP